MSSTMWLGNSSEDNGLEVWKEGLNTYIEVYSEDDRVTLSWVQAQQLYRWLKERLGE